MYSHNNSYIMHIGVLYIRLRASVNIFDINTYIHLGIGLLRITYKVL